MLFVDGTSHTGPDAAGAGHQNLPLGRSGPLRRGPLFSAQDAARRAAGRGTRGESPVWLRRERGLASAGGNAVLKGLFQSCSQAVMSVSGCVRSLDPVARTEVRYACTACGYSARRWFGKCPGCSAFGTLIEEPIGQVAHAKAPRKPLLRLVDVEVEEAQRMSTGVSEL